MLFSESPHELTAKEGCGRRSRLPVNTVHRFLVNLEEGAGFLNSTAGTACTTWESRVSQSARRLWASLIFGE